MARRNKSKTIPLCQSWIQYLFLKELYAGIVCAPSITESLWQHTLETLFLKIFACQGKTKSRNSSRRASGISNNYRYVAYRFLGLPSPEQEIFLSKNAGSARFLWNRMTADAEAEYKEKGSVTIHTPAEYKRTEGLEWLNEMDSFALCNVQLQFESARSDWLSGAKGKPRFKKKHLHADSYTTNKNSRSDNLAFDEMRGLLKLPKCKTQIRLRMHRKIREGGLLKSCTITHEPDGRWFFSLLYEYPLDERRTFSPGLEAFLETGDLSAIRHIGLDMSLPHMYVDSSGNYPQFLLNNVPVTFTRAYRRLEDKIAREQHHLSKMKKNSENYKRQCTKIAGLHAKAKHQRSDFIHQLAVRLARSYDIIGIEDLDMAAMKQALRFGKSVSDIGWGAFIDILEEKCLEYGSLLIRVNKWFPSSKTCCHCGHVNRELQLSDRKYICPVCGHEMDRDYQAALNIDAEGLRMVLDYLSATAALSPAA